MTAKKSNTVKFVQPAAKRYARVLYELEIPKADIEKTKEIFCQVPEVYEVLLNPVITAKNKYSVIEQIFPKSICNFLKVTCENQRRLKSTFITFSHLPFFFSPASNQLWGSWKSVSR